MRGTCFLSALVAVSLLAGCNVPEPLPVATLTGGTVTEGTGPGMTFVVTLDQAPPEGAPVTVAFATQDGTAVSAEDYVALSGTLTFNAGGPLSQQVVVPLLNDGRVEEDEVFTLVLSAPENVVLGSAQATGTVVSEDLPVIRMGENVSAAEGELAHGTLSFTVTVSETPPAARPVSVDWRTEASGAEEGTDYLGGSGTLTFTAGGPLTQQIEIVTLGDLVPEPREQLIVQLSGAVNAVLERSSAIGMIEPDETPVLSVQAVSAAEGNTGTTPLVFRVSVSGSVTQTVSVDWTTVDGSAVAPADYVAGSGTVTFVPGGPTSRELAVHAVGESVLETDETFRVRLSNPVNAALTVEEIEGTVLNDDFPALQISDASVVEGTGGGAVTLVFSVTLDQSPLAGSPVEVDWSTQDVTALAGLDYTGGAGTLTFLPGGALTQAVFVEVLPDAAIEPDETLRVNLASPQGATLADATATGTVRADDFPTVAIEDASKVEGNVGNSLGFPVRLSQPMPTGYVATVDYATVSGTAVAGQDFTQRTGTLTLPANGLATLSISLVGDLTREPDESFQVVLTNPMNTSLADADATGTVLNDDFAGVRISDATVVEGTGAGATELRFTLTVDTAPPAGETAQINWATSGLTATAGTDFQSGSGTLTFTSTDPLTRELAIPVTRDALVEPDETLEVTLSAPVRLTISDAVGRGTITADDFPTVSIADLTVDEGDYTWTANFAVTLSEPAPAGYPARVVCTTSPGTAQAGSDYSHSSPTLTFSGSAVLQNCPVSILGDTEREDDETLTVTLSGAQNVTVVKGTAVGTLVSDDGPSASLSGRFQVTEGDSGMTPVTLTVTLDGPPLPTHPAVFRWELLDGTARAPADVPFASGTLTFNPGQPTTQTFTVDVAGDTLPEGDEHFTVQLTPVAFGRVDLALALVEVLDDDQAQLTIADATVAEGASGTTVLQFAVSLSEPPAGGGPVTVQWRTEDRTALAASDYLAASGTVTFPSGGALEQTISVQVQGDLVTEPNEELAVLLSGAVNARLRDATGVGTVLDDDGVVIRVDATTTGVEDGLSWGSAYRTVQAGVDRAQALGGGQVWVAAGTYSTGGTVLTLRPNVTVAGGFQGFAAGTGAQETLWSQRNPRVQVTRLDGAGVAAHVVVGASNAVLDGFTVSGGNAGHPTVAADRSGGGMTLIGASALVVRTRFERNRAIERGGALLLSKVGFDPQPTPFIRDCEFVANQSADGGALYQGDVRLRISDSWFLYNRVTGFGSDGGGITVERGQLWVTDSTFVANDAEGSGGAMMNIFGAVELTGVRLLRNHTGSSGAGLYDYTGARIFRSEFVGNDADSQGGGIYVRGANTLVVDTLFEGNEASDGGGVKLWNGTGQQTRFERVRIVRNHASRGGGVYQVQGDAYYSDSVIEGNTASNGGGFASLGGDPLLVNVTFANNAAVQGTDFYLLHYESSPADPAKPVLRNSVLLNRDSATMVSYDAKCFGCTFTLTDSFSSVRDGNPMLLRVPLQVSYVYSASPGAPLWVARSGAFSVGDVAELDDDGVPRTVTAINGSYLTLSPAPARTLSRARVDNWGPGATDLVVSLAPAPLSPLIDKGNNGWVLADVGDVDGDGDLAEPTPRDLAGNPRFVDDPSVVDRGVGTAPLVDLGALERVP